MIRVFEVFLFTPYIKVNNSSFQLIIEFSNIGKTLFLKRFPESKRMRKIQGIFHMYKIQQNFSKYKIDRTIKRRYKYRTMRWELYLLPFSDSIYIQKQKMKNSIQHHNRIPPRALGIPKSAWNISISEWVERLFASVFGILMMIVESIYLFSP